MSLMTLVGSLGFIAVAACWALAVLLYRVGTSGSVARKLSFLLVAEGVILITAGFPNFAFNIPFSIFEQYPAAGIAIGLSHLTGDVTLLALYPPFLAATLQTRLTRPFAAKKVRVGLMIGAPVMALVLIFGPEPYAEILLYTEMVLLFIFAVVASLHAWYTAQGKIARDRARIFAFAFGIRDICWVYAYGAAAWMLWTGASYNPDSVFLLTYKAVYALGTLLAVPLIAYGILRTQLFDIDLRIRWTIKQSTVAAVFIAVIFIISEGASQFLSAELGNVVGLLAAGVLMFFLAPLQGFAERVAGAAMPNTHDTPEYTSFRKMQVYEAAVSEAQAEGGISNKERALLVHLRDSLGISETDASAIEADLQAPPLGGL